GVVGKTSVIPLAVTPGSEIPLMRGTNAWVLISRGNLINEESEYTRLVLSMINPAEDLLQYSNTSTVPSRLCSISCRLLVTSDIPAKTLGLAAASITQSTAGSDSRSLGFRMSPCRTTTPSSIRARRFSSLPGRLRLSIPSIWSPSRLFNNSRANVLPTKPQTPVINIFISCIVESVVSDYSVGGLELQFLLILAVFSTPERFPRLFAAMTL